MPSTTLQRPAFKPIPSYRERLAQAETLGYLRCDLPLGKLASIWEEKCFDRQIPFVVVAPRERSQSSFEIVYQLPPDDPFTVRPEALQAFLPQVEAARPQNSKGQVWLSPIRGLIEGLLPHKAEAVAFRLTELLNDPANLRNTELEEACV